jgi:hypothetical protein
MLRQDDYQKTKLVETGWQWGRQYGGHLAACIIMSVLGNRVRAGWGNWLEIIDRIPKFSATTNVPPYAPPQIWEPGFIRLLHEVDAIYDGSQDYANGALYWCDTRDINTEFFQNKILSDLETHPRILEMNTLVCFS